MGVYSIALYFRGKEGKDKVAHDLPPRGNRIALSLCTIKPIPREKNRKNDEILHVVFSHRHVYHSLKGFFGTS